MNFVFKNNEKLIENNQNASFMPEIGINIPTIYSGNVIYSCPNFIYDLRNINAIDKTIFSIKYDGRYGGQFIIGNDLSKYAPTRFKEEQYHAKYFYSKFEFRYNNIFLKDYWNKTVYMNITGKGNKKDLAINLNSGFIIGTEDFKNFIHEQFFKNLV